MGFSPVSQDSMCHDKINVYLAKIESVSWAKFSALLANSLTNIKAIPASGCNMSEKC